MPGWTISKNGPQGFLMGASKGVVRRLPVAKELIYDYIPVDIVVNNIIIAAYAVNQDRYIQISNKNELEYNELELISMYNIIFLCFSEIISLLFQ